MVDDIDEDLCHTTHKLEFVGSPQVFTQAKNDLVILLGEGEDFVFVHSSALLELVALESTLSEVVWWDFCGKWKQLSGMLKQQIHNEIHNLYYDNGEILPIPIPITISRFVVHVSKVSNLSSR